MNKKLMFWILALSLAAAPAFVAAQGGPDFDDEEMGMMGGPGRGGPEMGPGGQGRGGPGMQQGNAPQWREKGAGNKRQSAVNRKMMKRRAQGKRAFLSEDEIVNIIKKHDPAFSKKLAQLRENAPGKYKMVIQMAGKMLAMARKSKDEDVVRDGVRGLALEMESKELSLSYNQASESEKKSIKSSLKKVLSELFDLKTKGQAMRVKHMGDELKRLEKRLDKRKANKDKIVQQRLDQLTGEGFGW